MGTPSVIVDRSESFKSSAKLEPKSNHFYSERLQCTSPVPNLNLFRRLRRVFQNPGRLRTSVYFILAGVLLFLMPAGAFASQVTLAWDANQPSPDGYRVYQRLEGESYDYTNPAWPTDGNHHTETTCTITDLTEGLKYYFVVRAYVGNDQSGDSNEVSFYADQTTPTTYSITTTATANGSISPSGNISVTSGADQRFDFTPASGHHVADVAVDGQSIGAVSSYTFYNVIQNHAISVSFAATNYTITASSGQGGSVSPSGSVNTTYGSSRTFSITPNSGYRISAVAVDGQSIGAVASYTFSNVTQNHTLSASFTAIVDDNQPPIAQAGANQTVNQGDHVVLNGSGSFDPDGDAIAFHWLQKSGPSASLSGVNSVRCEFSAPDPNAQSAPMVFELTVTDSKGLFSGDTCVVLVNASQQAPDNDGDGMPDDQDSDDDNDGMPDDWEIQYGLNPMQNDAGQDLDNDGISNLDEFIAGSDPTQDAGNQPPDKPAIISPNEGESTVNLTPLLKASEFEDPDPGDKPSQSQWRIIFAGGDQRIVMDRTNTKKKLSQMQVPRLVLSPLTEYIVQVRYFDDHGQASSWSSPVAFSTAADSKDKNNNRIPDSQEVNADTDFNGDFIPDLQQETVVKPVSTYNDAYTMGVSVDSNDTSVQVQAAASVDPKDLVSDDGAPLAPEYEMPYGMIGFRIKLAHPGDTTTATIHLSETIDTQASQWIRYDEVNGMQSCMATSNMDDSGLFIERMVTDGGDEDADGTANGIYVGLSGPRVQSSTDGSSLAISTDTAAASGGSSGGCFIQSLF